MKRKTLKLFLLLCVILLSIFAFASCNDTPPENTPAANLEADRRKEIKDSEYIEFVLKNYNVDIIIDIFGPYDLNFLDLYRSSLSNNTIEIKEYTTSETMRLIAGYLPKESVELIFGLDAAAYLKSLNENSMRAVISYLENNNLTYQDIGFKLYYVDKRKIATNLDNEYLVYVGKERYAVDNSENYIKIIEDIEYYKIDENSKIEFTNSKIDFYVKSARYLRKAIDDKFVSSFDGCEIIRENGIDVLKEYEFYIRESLLSEEFLAAFSSAELYVETALDETEKEYILKRVYNYEKVKEILNIKGE